eukprot:245691_1
MADVIVFVCGILIILSFLVAICSFILHFYHHFEFHKFCKIEWCCSPPTNTYSSSRRSSIAIATSASNLTLRKTNSVEAWGRKISHRASIATAIVAEEVKQNNCCCCHIIEKSQLDKDRLCCCLYSSVDSMEFYPLAVTLYFIILICVIIFISYTLYYIYYIDYIGFYSFTNLLQDAAFGMNKQIQTYCTLDKPFYNVQNMNFYEKSPISNIKKKTANIYITIDYILVIALILWESLLNWYRFYSTKFMSLKFTTPPYIKIFGLFGIYTLLFLCLCIIQMYIIFLLFPIIIIIHLFFNSYCVYGFIFVLNNQYKHYVQGSQGVSEIIINDLKTTMFKLKICAICCVISSTLFLLTFSLCHYGDIVILSAPLWWITNCICWMLTFAKNTLWFKHKFTNCFKCFYYKFNNKNTKPNINSKSKDKKQEMEQKTIEMVEMVAKVENEILSKERQPLSTLIETDAEVEMDSKTEIQQNITMTPISPDPDQIIQPTFNRKLSNDIHDSDTEYIESMDTETQNRYENIVSGIKLPTIDDNKEFKDSPMSIIKMNTRVSRNNSLAAPNNNTTPMSIVITPAGQPPQQTRIHRNSSVTYQYPNDYDTDNETSDYFTFPNGINSKHSNAKYDTDIEESMTVQTMSKKPKALDILGVIEYEETSKTEVKNLKIESIHVPNVSVENNSENKGNEKDVYYPNNVHIDDEMHKRQVSKTVTYEPSHNLWELFVHNGFMSSQTIRSLHQLEDYTVAANEQIQTENSSASRQLSSHL